MSNLIYYNKKWYYRSMIGIMPLTMPSYEPYPDVQEQKLPKKNCKRKNKILIIF